MSPGKINHFTRIHLTNNAFSVLMFNKKKYFNSPNTRFKVNFTTL